MIKGLLTLTSLTFFAATALAASQDPNCTGIWEIHGPAQTEEHTVDADSCADAISDIETRIENALKAAEHCPGCDDGAEGCVAEADFDYSTVNCVDNDDGTYTVTFGFATQSSRCTVCPE